jgi:hypothetical protein
LKRHIWTADRPQKTAALPLRQDADLLLNDKGSDSNSDVESILSAPYSANSSKTSVQNEISRIAADGLVDLLCEDDLLNSLYITALENTKIGPDRFERNLRRLLNQFSADLKSEAQNTDQKAAVLLIRLRSRYIANNLRRKIAPSAEDMTYDKVKEQRKNTLSGSKKVEAYLDSSLVASSDGQFDDLKSDSDLDSKDDASDGGSTEYHDYEEFPKLSRVKEFMVTSHAFSLFRNNIRQFVCPSFETKLRGLVQQISQPVGPEQDIHGELSPTPPLKLTRLVVEWEYISPSDIQIVYDYNSSLMNRFKCVFEDLTKESWDWWPLEPPKRPLPSEKARVIWHCVRSTNE